MELAVAVEGVQLAADALVARLHGHIHVDIVALRRRLRRPGHPAAKPYPLHTTSHRTYHSMDMPLPALCYVMYFPFVHHIHPTSYMPVGLCGCAGCRL